MTCLSGHLRHTFLNKPAIMRQMAHLRQFQPTFLRHTRSTLSYYPEYPLNAYNPLKEFAHSIHFPE